ncbi:UNVERIFIED_CONTAM: hypothetical protein Scaly_0077400 [Sesamum calycinum]|uniref:Transposase MuDR plant domain-containing protein n=1 Tax=Sesamum calycinum TaxID=2727403 RepID=A0AAW2SUL9_9LAMI
MNFSFKEKKRLVRGRDLSMREKGRLVRGRVGFEGEGERETGEGQGGNGQSVDAFGANKETDFQNKQNEKMNGKRKRVEVDYNDMSASGFDDSSDGEDGSDNPSLVLEDVEGLSDEDIFASKNKNRNELRAKLKKFRKEIPKKRIFQDFSVNDDDNAGWYSDPGEDSDFENVPDEAGDAKRHCYYKDTTKTKDLELVVGMKFASGKIFREVLRDWCVRHGYDLEFIGNETQRITAKCKKGCNWRIHASPIQNEQTFQIKSLKGEHNCARTYVNSLAQSKYLAKRMEGAIRDKPNIGIAQLKNTIMRKCRLDVSKSKIKRAKRETLDAIRGVDAVQYNMLCDYCETVRVNNPVFGGQMLVAVGRDANDNTWPIALAIVPVENRENWCWFIREMLDDIGGLGTNRWSFISDSYVCLKD